MSKIPTHTSPQKVSFRRPPTSPDSQRHTSHAEGLSNHQLSIGDRVDVSGKSGTIAYIGPAEFAAGLIHLKYIIQLVNQTFEIRRMGWNYS